MRIFARTLPALLAWLTLSSGSQAAIIHFASQEIPIPSTFTGVSVELETGATSNSISGLSGGDANFFFGGANISNDADGTVSTASWQPVRTGNSNTSAVANLSLGTTVGPGSTYDTTPDPPAFGSSSTHVGIGGGPHALPLFTNGVSGYIGFSLDPSGGGGPYYGWMRVTLYNDGTPGGGTDGTIHEWAYEDLGNPLDVGVIPEPSSGALALIGFAALAARRRRR